MRIEPHHVELALVAFVSAVTTKANGTERCREVMERAKIALADLPAEVLDAKRLRPESARNGAIVSLRRVCIACGACPLGAVIRPPTATGLLRRRGSQPARSPLGDSDPPL